MMLLALTVCMVVSCICCYFVQTMPCSFIKMKWLTKLFLDFCGDFLQALLECDKASAQYAMAEAFSANFTNNCPFSSWITWQGIGRLR